MLYLSKTYINSSIKSIAMISPNHSHLDEKKYYWEDTHVTPTSNLVEQIITSKTEVHNAFVDSATRSLRCEVSLRDLHPTQRAYEEPDRASVVWFWTGRETATSEMWINKTSVKYIIRIEACKAEDRMTRAPALLSWRNGPILTTFLLSKDPFIPECSCKALINKSSYSQAVLCLSTLTSNLHYASSVYIHSNSNGYLFLRRMLSMWVDLTCKTSLLSSSSQRPDRRGLTPHWWYFWSPKRSWRCRTSPPPTG